MTERERELGEEEEGVESGSRERVRGGGDVVKGRKGGGTVG